MRMEPVRFEFERRSEKRRKRSEPVWWRAGARGEKIGWLLERSARGAAFISVGEKEPRVAEPLDVKCWSPECGCWRTLRGYVRRVQRLHDGLFLVGMFCLIDRPRLRREAARATRRGTLRVPGRAIVALEPAAA